MYKGDVGIDNVNKIIQEKFNPESVYLKREKISLKKMDKVMQLKNNYEKEIFNGEQGIVADFDESKRILVVDYDGYFVEYDIEEMDELSLSYAVSIHKSQGSEYDTVILVLLPSHSLMLNREIFYTAVSRAKKRFFLISEESTIQRALLNSTPFQRKTMLPIRLKEFFEPPSEKKEF
jgi:exodeoxyribonuclease V alpha subunit